MKQPGQRLPDGLVVRRRSRGRQSRGHSTEQMLGPGRGAICEQEPGGLQVRQVRELAEEVGLATHAVCRGRLDISRRADRGAQGKEAALFWRLLASTPDIRAKVSDAWWWGATCPVEDPGLAQVRRDA